MYVLYKVGDAIECVAVSLFTLGQSGRKRGSEERQVGLGLRLYKLCLVGVSAMRDEAFFCSPRQPTHHRPTTHGLCKTTQCTHGSESTLCR